MEHKKKRKIVLEGFIRFKIKRRRFSCLRLHIYKQQSILIISAESDARAVSRVFCRIIPLWNGNFQRLCIDDQI
jgi:hypothetical protein